MKLFKKYAVAFMYMAKWSTIIVALMSVVGIAAYSFLWMMYQWLS